MRSFDVSIPTLDGKEVAELVTIQIPMEWDEEIGEWLMTDEGLQQVEEQKRTGAMRRALKKWR